METIFMPVKILSIFLLSFFMIPIFFVYGENQSEIDSLLEQGMNYFGQEDYEKAISEFDKILKIDSNNVDALFNKANTLSKIEKYNEAIPYYVQVLDLEPGKYIAQLKLEHALLQVTSYRYGFLDGVLEITVHDSHGSLVAYHRASKILAIKHQIIEDVVEKWPIIKEIKKNDQSFNVHQKNYVKLVETDTIYGFHEMPLSEKVDFPLATTWHYQIPVEKGDIVSYTYSIFRPTV